MRLTGLVIALSAFTATDALSQMTAVVIPKSSFKLVTDKDPINDAIQSFIVSRNPDTGETLTWGCGNDGMTVVFDLNGVMAGNRRQQVMVVYRFDKRTAVGPAAMELSSNKQFAFLPLRAVPMFTTMARHADSITVRVTDPLDGETKTYSVGLQGLANALPLLKGCK